MPISDRSRAWALIVALCVCPSPGFGAEPYYMWTDENGILNYSNKKPKGVDARRIEEEHRFGEKLDARPANDTSSDPIVSEPSPVTGKEDSSADYQNAAEQFLQQAKEAKREACNRAREDLERFQERGRMRMRDAEGKVRILSDEEKHERMQQFELTIDENCDQ